MQKITITNFLNEAINDNKHVLKHLVQETLKEAADLKNEVWLKDQLAAAIIEKNNLETSLFILKNKKLITPFLKNKLVRNTKNKVFDFVGE